MRQTVTRALSERLHWREMRSTIRLPIAKGVNPYILAKECTIVSNCTNRMMEPEGNS